MSVVVLLSRDSLLLKQLQAAFARCVPQLQAVLADDPRAAQATMAACWFPPAGSLGCLPNLQVIHSVAAGIDHLEHDPSCPDLPICRVVDPGHRQGMTEYLRWAVIHYHRGFDRVLEQQRERHWERPLQRPARQFKVGVMGLGSWAAPLPSTWPPPATTCVAGPVVPRAWRECRPSSGRGNWSPFSMKWNC